MDSHILTYDNKHYLKVLISPWPLQKKKKKKPSNDIYCFYFTQTTKWELNISQDFFVQEIWRCLFIPLRIFSHKNLSLVKVAGEWWEFIFLSCLWIDSHQNSHAKISLLSAKTPPPKQRSGFSDLKFILYHNISLFQDILPSTECLIFSSVFLKTLAVPNLACVVSDLFYHWSPPWHSSPQVLKTTLSVA